MTEPLPRDDVIELLQRLGSERDEDVLEAAREVHARIAAAEMTWEELLVPEGGVATDDDEDDYDTDDYDTGDDDAGEDDAGEDDGDDEFSDSEDKTTGSAGKKGAKQAESLALIDKILALPGVSSDLREEMKDFKTDIAEGEFQTRDHRYLVAVYKRLSKKR